MDQGIPVSCNSMKRSYDQMLVAIRCYRLIVVAYTYTHIDETTSRNSHMVWKQMIVGYSRVYSIHLS